MQHSRKQAHGLLIFWLCRINLPEDAILLFQSYMCQKELCVRRALPVCDVYLRKSGAVMKQRREIRHAVNTLKAGICRNFADNIGKTGHNVGICFFAEDDGWGWGIRLYYCVTAVKPAASKAPPEPCFQIGSNPHHVKKHQPRKWLVLFWQRMRDSNCTE